MLVCNYDTDCHMVINTNIPAARGARFLGEASGNLQKSLARLSSGSKIVEPQDDAAGLAVASRMDAQINRTEATRSNIGNAISYKQTQDGYLAKVGKALDRMSELATLAQDQTKTVTDLSLYNAEYSTLYSYIDVIDNQQFNGVDLFGSSGINVLQQDSSIAFTTGTVNLGVVTTSLSSIAAATTTTSGSTSTVSHAYSGFETAISSSNSAAQTSEVVKSAISKVATFRSSIGADLSRLMMTNDHLAVLSENLQSSVSRIKDVDVATESAKYAKYNILVQSGTAMLAQANSLPQSALRLLS
jgi:flagellin